MANKKTEKNKNIVSAAGAQNASVNQVAGKNTQYQAVQPQPLQPAETAVKGKKPEKNNKKTSAPKKEKGKSKKTDKAITSQTPTPIAAPQKKLSKAEIKAAAKEKKKQAFNVKPFYDPQTGWNSHNDQILYEMACEKVHRLKKQIKQENHPVMRLRLIDIRDNYELLIEKMIYRDYVSVNNMWNSGMLANPNPQEAARERALALAANRSAGLPEPVIGQVQNKQTLIEATTGEDENKEIRAFIKKKEKHRIRLKIVPIISLLLFLLYIVAIYVPYYMTGPFASNGLGIVLSIFDLPFLSAAASVKTTILGLLNSIGLDGTEALFYKGIMEGGNFPLSAAAIQGETIFNTIMGYGTLFSLTLAFLLAVISVFMNFVRIFSGAKKVQFITFLCFLFSVIAAIGLCLTNMVDGNFSDALFNTVGWDVSATNGMGYMLIATVFIPFIAFIFPLFFPQKSKYIDEIEKNKAKLDHEKIVTDAKEHAVEVNKENIYGKQSLQQNYQQPAAQSQQNGMPNNQYPNAKTNQYNSKAPAYGQRPPQNGVRPPINSAGYPQNGVRQQPAGYPQSGNRQSASYPQNSGRQPTGYPQSRSAGGYEGYPQGRESAPLSVKIDAKGKTKKKK